MSPNTLESCAKSVLWIFRSLTKRTPLRSSLCSLVCHAFTAHELWHARYSFRLKRREASSSSLSNSPLILLFGGTTHRGFGGIWEHTLRHPFAGGGDHFAAIVQGSTTPSKTSK